jgi:hypothetical protein
VWISGKNNFTEEIVFGTTFYFTLAPGTDLWDIKILRSLNLSGDDVFIARLDW